ncbi:MAG: hypoxanthine phosphoribosyltransferase [Defluviitaleaceae bacterium]|nr:hypoxanthine phosphoribosyltransferase [Defluviitaleaceae bacterium]
MKNDIKDILFSEEVIRKRVTELGAQIEQDYMGKSPLLIGVLKGCFVFLADIARNIGLDCEIRFLTASSYGFSSITSGKVRIGKDFDYEIEGRDVIIIEDILDSGVTLAALRDFVSERSPSSLKICALLDKPSRRQVPIETDYLGFECPDEFVVGYGLDYAERYRNLPFIASLKPEIYS